MSDVRRLYAEQYEANSEELDAEPDAIPAVSNNLGAIGANNGDCGGNSTLFCDPLKTFTLGNAASILQLYGGDTTALTSYFTNVKLREEVENFYEAHPVVGRRGGGGIRRRER